MNNEQCEHESNGGMNANVLVCEYVCSLRMDGVHDGDGKIYSL